MAKALQVDEKSWELALHFLPADASEDDKRELAGAIQLAVEDWFAAQEAEEAYDCPIHGLQQDGECPRC